MLSKKKKIIVLSVMCTLLILTGVLNVVLNNKTPKANTGLNNSLGFFATYRQDRESTRQLEILYLDAMINNPSSSNEIKANAEAKRMSIISMMEMELVCEGLIKAKGFEEAVVSASSNSLNVVVKSTGLNEDEVAQIVSIIQQQSGLDIDVIKVIPVS